MSSTQNDSFLYTFPNHCRENADSKTVMDWHPGTAPFGTTHFLQYNDALNTIQVYPQALSEDECDQVIDFGECLPRANGRVELGSDTYRVSHIAWIEPHPEMQWLYHKLGALFTKASLHYGFELIGFIDALQYTVYGADQHFDWHMDIGNGSTSTRKLSMTVQLSDNGEFKGGELQFLNAPPRSAMGSATFFPSFMAHRVSPVTSGTRRSLVAWACGPAFR